MRKLAEIRATSIGPIAAEILRQAHDLDVVAVFERSFYLMAPNGIVCVALEALGAGPLNVLIVPATGVQPWTGGLPAETKAVTGAGRLTVGSAFTIDLAQAKEWRPPPWPARDQDTLVRGLAALRGVAVTHLPADGLAALVFAPDHRAARTATAEAATGLVRDFRAALPQALADEVWPAAAIRAATLLVGLGPGLTPSGDDFLGGVMLALSAIDRAALRDSLWEAIGPELDDLTVPISAMHLAAAADGMGAEAMHNFLAAILAGDAAAMARMAPSMDALGATSGWDAVAGAAVMLEAASAVQTNAPHTLNSNARSSSRDSR